MYLGSQAGREDTEMNTQDIEFGLDSFSRISVDESGRELSGDAVGRQGLEPCPPD